MVYSFSVGNLVLKQSGATIKTIEFARNIALDYRINTHKEYGPEGQVTSEDTETEDLTVNCDFLEATFDTGLDVGAYFDIYLSLGGPDGTTGISLILANCKVTAYSIKSAQGEFVVSTFTFSKSGKLEDIPGSTAAVQTVKFGSIYIGDHASVNVSYDGNVIDYILPTALGIKMMSTGYVGGGKLGITVNGYVKKESRIEIEQYLVNLYTTLSTTADTLTVTYGGTSYTLTNVCFVRGSSSGGTGKYSNFSLEFLKSAF
jgi:hypothetical protein